VPLSDADNPVCVVKEGGDLQTAAPCRHD